VAYLKPGFFLSSVVNPLLSALHIKPVLVVAGRKSGNFYELPVNVLEHEGKRYLVAPRGDTQWARNLRAAGTGELQKGRRHSEVIEAIEVPDEQKPELIAAYRARWEGETKRFWKALPDPADHPVFEIRKAD
jgi:deazaflavin-dependent oxidoreductase (nitroreductase family)